MLGRGILQLPGHVCVLQPHCEITTVSVKRKVTDPQVKDPTQGAVFQAEVKPLVKSWPSEVLKWPSL